MSTESQLDTVQMMVNMGPQHPSTHGVFRMLLWVDGERVVDVEPYIGYLHRGAEKLCEGELYAQIVTLFDRLDYISNFNNELVFCMAVEKLMGLEIPERAEYIRVLMCELNRVASHLLFFGTMGLDVGAMTPRDVHLPGPGEDTVAVRGGERRADDAQLHPHWRRKERPAGRLHPADGAAYP